MPDRGRGAPPQASRGGGHLLSAILAAVLGLLAPPGTARALTGEEREFLSRYRALLEVSFDSCRVAPRMEAEYRRLLRAAGPEQDVSDILAAVEGKFAIPFRLASGIRVAEGSAMYDPETKTIYLSGAFLAKRLPAEACPSDKKIRNLALETVGVYVHEICHALERRVLGDDIVNTSEGEILAYARETRFLAGLKGWPDKAVTAELSRRQKRGELVARNQEILGRMEETRGKPTTADFGLFGEYLKELEGIRQRLERLDAREKPVDPMQVSLVVMLDAWRAGWPDFIRLMVRHNATRPSLSRREENLEASRRFLEASIAGLKKEEAGTLAHQFLERGVRLGEQDVRFWGDEKMVETALEFYKRRFREVRPTHPSAGSRH